jgi:hypothetical protein
MFPGQLRIDTSSPNERDPLARSDISINYRARDIKKSLWFKDKEKR